MSVMNRKMFNRGARKELRKKGGIADVQYFQTAGQVKAPSGKLSLNLSGGPFASSSPIFGSGKYNLGQIYSKNNPYPSTSSGKMFGSGKRFFAPAKSSSPSQMGLINLAKKAAEGGMGALKGWELALLQQYMTGQGLQNLVEDTGITSKLGLAGDAAGGIANVLGQVAGFPVGLIQSAFTEEGGPASKEYDKNLGTFTPDERLLKQLGFVFEEDLYGGQKGKTVQGGDPELAAELAKGAVAPSSKINPGELQKMLQSSGKEIEAILNAQGDKGMTVFAEEDEFNKDAKPAVITSFDKKGNEIEAQPFGKPSATAEEIAAEGPGEQLDKVDESFTEEQIGQILGRGIEDTKKVVEEDSTDTDTDTDTDTKKDEQYKLNRGAKDPAQDAIINPAETVKEVFKTGTNEEKVSTIDDMIKQFTDRAPKYEGINQGLAIAKIGFAMAAGESPNALTNIAKALSDGADMLIKDKKERDAYKRQVDLSALQYGLTESSKIRAEQRLEERTFTDFVDKEGNLVRVTLADYKANGNKLPENLQTIGMLTANQKAINDRVNSYKKLSEDLYKKKFLKFSDQTKITGDYSTAIKLASEAETAGTLIETVIMNSGDVVGGYSEAKQVGANFLNFFGVTPPKGWNNKKLRISELKAALQSVVKTTLGTTQSANSISNRDVELLIEGFLAEGVITYNEKSGIVDMSTAFISREQFVASLQKGLGAVRRAQAGALNQMTSIENQLRGAYTATGYDASTIIDPLRTGLVMPGSVGKEGFKQGSLKLGGDGIWSPI
jgi:hypothetical protein